VELTFLATHIGSLHNYWFQLVKPNQNWVYWVGFKIGFKSGIGTKLFLKLDLELGSCFILCGFGIGIKIFEKKKKQTNKQTRIEVTQKFITSSNSGYL